MTEDESSRIPKEEIEESDVGFQHRPPIMCFGSNNTEVPKFKLTPEVFKNMKADVCRALEIADAALQNPCASEKEQATSELQDLDENSDIFLESEPNSPSSAQKRFEARRNAFMRIPVADKMLYQAFKGCSFKGTPTFDMTGIGKKEKKILDLWDKHNRMLLKATCVGNSKLAKSLIAVGADQNIYDTNRENATVLILASAAGHRKIVSYLLNAHCNVDSQTLLGRTALMEAAENGHLSIVKKLVKARAYINTADDSGATAMSLARDKGHSEVVSFLESVIARKSSRVKSPQGVKADVGATSHMTGPSEEPIAGADGSQATEPSAAKVEVAPFLLPSEDLSSEEACSSWEGEQVVSEVPKAEESK